MDLALPIGFAVLLWWLSTGAILWLVGRPASYGITARVATASAFAALLGVVLLREETGLGAAYLGFALGIVSWGWHEVMFLLGFVSGPRKTPCPPQLAGNRRFFVSLEAVLHHEIALLVHGALLFLVSLGSANMVAAQTFLVLWIMRVSAKLLVFFGAPNIPTHFLPNHLLYLGSYFRRAANPAAALLALGATSTVAAGLVSLAFAAPSGGFAEAAFVLLSTLATLAVFEHLALVIRVPDQPLWAWAVRPACENPDTKTTGRSRSR
jgi:putative photosynthetic complex assembly protein 2